MGSWSSSKNHTRSKETDLNRQEIVKIFFKRTHKINTYSECYKVTHNFYHKKRRILPIFSHKRG